jgi:DNA-binding response OmpR family regulator
LRLLLVEDDPRIALSLSAALENENYVVDLLDRLEDAVEAVKTNSYALAVIDLHLPDGSGLDLVRLIATLPNRPRVLILTVDGQTRSKIDGLDAGADDYLQKPFDIDELLARLRALRRRWPSHETRVIKIGAIRLDLIAREAQVHGVPLRLPRRELLILETLLVRAGRVASREMLESAIYGIDDAVGSNTLDAQISRLRGRLNEARAGVRISALRGLGYMLEPVTAEQLHPE